MTEVITDDAAAPVLWKRVSWPAIFGGTLVALATELLFVTFGVFIGFLIANPGGIETWSEIWYLTTCFISLLIGGWVAGRTAAVGSPRVHGAVTWGLTTLATFLIALWMFWGVVSASLTAVRTTVAATNNAAASAAPVAAAEANTLQRQAAAAVNTATQNSAAVGDILTTDGTWVSGIMWGGIFLGCIASLVGSTLSGRQTSVLRTYSSTTTARTATA